MTMTTMVYLVHLEVGTGTTRQVGMKERKVPDDAVRKEKL